MSGKLGISTCKNITHFQFCAANTNCKLWNSTECKQELNFLNFTTICVAVMCCPDCSISVSRDEISDNYPSYNFASWH